MSQNPSVEIPDAKQSEQPASPLIARTAALTISVQNFQAARSSVDQIVRARDGYVGELKITSPKDGPQSLETTLRIPAAEFDAALASLRALGRVDEEQQGGEEVTAQVVDLDARLKLPAKRRSAWPKCCAHAPARSATSSKSKKRWRAFAKKLNRWRASRRS